MPAAGPDRDPAPESRRAAGANDSWQAMNGVTVSIWSRTAWVPRVTRGPLVAGRCRAIPSARGLDACLPCGSPECQLRLTGLLVP